MSTTPASNGSPPPNGHGPGRTLEKLLVDSREAAEMISVSRATWARMVSAGKTPAPIKLSGGCVRFRADWLRQWVQWGCPDRFVFQALVEQQEQRK